MNEISSVTKEFRQRLLNLGWNRRGVLYTTVWLFVIGTVTLVLRTLTDTDVTIVFYILVGGFFALAGIAYLKAWRVLPTRERINAYLAHSSPKISFKKFF